MPAFDFECKEHGVFDELWCDPFTESRLCPKCGEPAPKVWRTMPNLDRTAAAGWAGIGDPQTGMFTDKKAYYAAIDRQGRYIGEPGMDKDAESNHKHHVAKLNKAFDEKVDNYYKDWTLDEMRNAIKVDAKIHDATVRGDGNAIKAMGGLTSLDEAYERVNS